ncbi:serine hydrolase [Gordonia phage Lozinak]|uniref:Serine hydrolase n=2 Tax=Smoothievirus TaxID=1982557 RepID=A0A2D1GGE4_9CAUD|nr:serine hydrolase [Gordonia phage ClubL]YP_009281301.1 serine hydrolase [Gordonia phage Cucurbita]ATN90774.1 serine hydrolase [Gordonia phage Lozinak]AUE23654.1 serine hydrolase [Gordonia phage Toniann]QYC53630.1 serine hydrolase [Gordonia phage Norvs]ANA86645.1 serine hydrolase [Gordonia phage ClubL]AOE44232.1 serine hydrolase [Gordonia phage Cucurbita]
MRILGLLLAALIAVCGVNTVQAGDSHAGGCPSVQRYAVGGNADPTSSRVRAPYPRVNIAYPANVFAGDYSRDVAMAKLSDYARTTRALCPDTAIEVYGFSLGASVASAVVDHWQADPVMNRNTTAVYYGNPRRPVDYRGRGGIEAVGLPNIPGIYTFWGQRGTGPIPIVEVCNLAWDIICDAPVPLHRDLPASWQALWGYLTTGHRY